MEADPADLDASLGMVRREPGRVNAHRGLCVYGDETLEQQRTVSSRMLPPTREPEEGPMRQMRTPSGRSWLAECTRT